MAKYVSLARKQMRRHRASVHVADAPHGANAFRTVPQAPQFAPQVARKDVDATVGRKIFAVEYAFRQIFAMNDTSSAAQKRREQLKLGGGQFDKLATSSTCPRAFVHFEIPNLEILGRRAEISGKRACQPSGDGPDVCDQLAWTKWLGQIVVGATLEPDDPVGLLGARAEQENADR